MATAAGILNIIVGIICFLASFVCFQINAGCSEWYRTSELKILIVIGIICGLFGAFAVVGGIYALLRRKWRWALAGSIFSVLSIVGIPFGILAVIFTISSKDEFE